MKSIQRYLREYRDEIKGLAILWVVFFHAQLGLDGFMYEVQRIGYGGVDMFLFLSGFGLYHSLKKNADLKHYLIRRAGRLLPAYLPFCLVWLAVMIPLSGMGMGNALRTAAGNLLMIGYFSDVPLMINWYVSALAASVLIAPLLFAALGEKTTLKRTMVMLVLSFGVGLCFLGSDQYMAASRLPVFALGMAFAAPWTEKENGGRIAVRMAAGVVVGYVMLRFSFARFPQLLVPYALYWHPFVLMTPGLCMAIGFGASKCPPRLLAPLRALGKASFEIFLFNVWVEVLGKRHGLADGALSWALWSGASIAAGLAYHKAIAAVSARLMQKRKFFEKRG